jgi:hypothetical protein
MELAQNSLFWGFGISRDACHGPHKIHYTRQFWSYINNNRMCYQFSLPYTQYTENFVIEKQRGFDRIQQ